MPGIEDWLNCPLAIIQRLFEEDPGNHDAKITEYFTKRLATTKSSGQLPSLNDIPTHNIPTNSLVHFRTMVQDMHDPEFYLGVYEVENIKTGQKSLRSGKFRDIAECGPNEEIKLDSSQNKTFDRQTFYCIPVPAEARWVKEEYAKQNGSHTLSHPSTSSSNERLKRSLDEDDDLTDKPVTESANTENNGDSMDTDTPAENGDSSAENKKTKKEETTGSANKENFQMNFPLPGEKGPACFVKVYSCEDNLKLNDVVEIIGVLSNDPAMAVFPDKKEKSKSAFVDPNEQLMEGLEDCEVQSPPPSLVPRLHALTVRKLGHINPLLPQASDSDALDKLLAETEATRSRLLSVLQRLLFGDALAAEYLLCHLVSCVYARHDVVAVGKYALNISGCPRSGNFPKLLHGFLKELLTKCHFLPLMIDSMNKLNFTPKKDYSVNRLQSGVLQLSDKTHLILDETTLQPGQLNTNGVNNMTALGNVISWQKADYDFSFHKQEFPTDIITLVISEGKSILKCDCQVPLVATGGGFPDDLEGHFQSVLAQELPGEDSLKDLRIYISLVQQIPYELPDSLQKEIEDDFVNIRKDNKSNMSVDDFHALLILARLLSLTRGQKILSRETWERAKVLEIERKTRLVLTSPPV